MTGATGMFENLKTNFRQGYRQGSGDAEYYWREGVVARPPEVKDHDYGAEAGDSDFLAGLFGAGGGHDEHAEYKAVIAGLLEKSRRQAEAIAALNSQLRQWQAALDERDRYIARLHTERDKLAAARDRFAANGKKLLAETTELRALNATLEALRRFPRVDQSVRKALNKAFHPNGHLADAGGEREQRALTEIYQRLTAVLDRIGGS